MQINYQNKEAIISKKLHYIIHDSGFVGLQYDQESKWVKVVLEPWMEEEANTLIILEFSNVFGFEMKTFNPWAPINCVYHWEPSDGLGKPLSNKLCAENQESGEFSTLIENSRIVESLLTLHSGDALSIACEFVDVKRQLADGSIVDLVIEDLR